MTTLAAVQSGLFIAYAIMLHGRNLSSSDGKLLKTTAALAGATVLASLLALLNDALGVPWPSALLVLIGTYGVTTCGGMIGTLLSPLFNRTPRPTKPGNH